MPCFPMFRCARSCVQTEEETAELRRATAVVQQLSDRYQRAKAVAEAARSLAGAAQSAAADGGFVRLPVAGMNALRDALAALDAGGTTGRQG